MHTPYESATVFRRGAFFLYAFLQSGLRRVPTYPTFVPFSKENLMQFHLHQRYTSETEPELGIGIVTEAGKGRVKLEFGKSGEARMYAAGNAPLRRIIFKPGDTVLDSIGRSFVVERVEEREGLCIYFGEGRILPEMDLGEMVVKHGPDDRLSQGDVDAPSQFSLRRRTMEMDHRRRTSSIQGFMGGRIDLIPHQLYIAYEVSSRHAPRVLLSDEVGLGKTIEACMIMHRLLLSGRASRVLVLVPESLVHQWFVELLRRFNLWFHIFDEERCASIEEGAPEGNPFLENQWVLTSTAFLAGSSQRAQQAHAAGWDLLVVDEAHHLEWTVEQVSPEYQMVDLLSQQTPALLLLTATPEQLGPESHFARLRLLDPDRYPSFDVFIQEAKDQQATADIAIKLVEGADLDAAEQRQLAQWVGEERIAQAAAEGEEGKQLLIQDLLDQYGPGRVVFRNRRAAMQGFPKRIPHLVPLTAEFSHDFWLENMQAEFEAELRLTAGTLVRKSFQFDRDPRLDWLAKFLEEIHPAKVLLICNAKQKVLALEKALAERISLKVGVFHEDLTLVQRDRYAAWFSEPDGARLLICSEIGSEGRNFQFAHHLVLFDLPAQPDLLEQRIGRLDRIGQTQDIHIHVPYFTGSPQEVLVRWYQEGLNAFAQNLEGGHNIARQFSDRLIETAKSIGKDHGPAQMEALISETQAFHAQLKVKMASGRDRLLEINSFRPDIAESLVAEIQEADQNTDLETFMLEVFEEYGIYVEDLAPRTYLIYAQSGNAQAFPGIPDEGLTLTFDRKRALSREEIAFMTWDHPLVTGVLDRVMGGTEGNASYGKIKTQGSPAVLLEALFVLETATGHGIALDRFLPNTPIRIILDQTHTEVTDFYPTEEWDLRLREGFVEDWLANETFVEALLPRMVEAATEMVEENAMRLRASGLRRMNTMMGHEIKRLKALQEKNNHIRPAEIEWAEKVQEQFKRQIVESTVRLDSVQLVQKGLYFEKY